MINNINKGIKMHIQKVKQRMHFLFFSFAIILSSCTSNDPDVKAEIIYARKPTPYYTVKETDTIQSICSKYKMNEDDFVATNHLTAPFDLIPGQKVIIYPKGMETSNKINTFESDGISVSNEEPSLVESSTLTNENKNTEEDTIKNNDEGSDNKKEPEEKPVESNKKYKWPVRGKVVKRFGDAKNGQFSKGISIAAPEGTPVYAAEEGVVLKSNVILDGFGKTVVIQHNDQSLSVYSHLKICLAKVGQKVNVKTVIGRVGKTGGIKKPELHFQLRNATKEPVNPMMFLK